MSRSERLHREAIELVDQAELARQRDPDSNRFRVFLQRAFEKERQAAEEFQDQEGPEPTRSILLRSAASLAFEIDDLDEAERLVDIALRGNPPETISQEIKTLRRSINTRRVTIDGIAPDRKVEESSPEPPAQLLGLVQAIEPYLEKAMMETSAKSQRLLLAHYGLAIPGFESPDPKVLDSTDPADLLQARLEFNRHLEDLLEGNRDLEATRRRQALQIVKALL